VVIFEKLLVENQVRNARRQKGIAKKWYSPGNFNISG